MLGSSFSTLLIALQNAIACPRQHGSMRSGNASDQLTMMRSLPYIILCDCYMYDDFTEFRPWRHLPGLHRVLTQILLVQGAIVF